MSYTKTTWRNNQSPAINADNLNHIEQGIYDAHDGLASANNNMELMDNRLQAEIDDANSDISTLESNLAAETSARTQQDSVLSARMDTFTQLPSGSTSGDAELIDIRVGADGTTYSTAGDAVRGQVSDLKTDLFNLQDEYLLFDLIPNSYVTTSGVITYDATWSRTDYLDCGGAEYLIADYTLGNGSMYNCFYDSSKTFISSFAIDSGSKGNPIKIPDNAKYFIMSNAPNYLKSTTVILHPTNSEKIKNNTKILDDIAAENSELYIKSTSGVTLYSTNGYIGTTNGAFYSNASYQCYYFTMPRTANLWFDNPDGWTEIAVYDTTIFDTTKLKALGASSRSNLPTIDKPIVAESGRIVAVCVAKDANFALYMGTGSYITKGSAVLPKIKIVPIYSSTFNVEVLDEVAEKYLKYAFYHATFTDTMTYGNGQSKSVKTYDVWFNNNINDENGDLVFQGNTNFIHALDETGHTGHVGAGHGCTVMDCALFFADGKPFDPSTLATPIECSSFRFVIKAKHYLIDDAITTDPSHALPVLDDNGDPIVTSEWVFDGTWTANNKIEMNNHLEIKRANTKFRQCHAGMLCGFYPNIDNAMLSGRKGLYWNSTSESGGVFTDVDESDSNLVFTTGTTTSVIANFATIFGDSYVAKQDFWQNDPEMYGKENILAWMPPNGDSRLKMYLMPCVCSESTALISEGKTEDVFGVGDAIDVCMVRTIGITPN